MSQAPQSAAKPSEITAAPPADLCGISVRALVMAVVLTFATYLGINRLGFMQMVPPVPALIFLLILQGMNVVLGALARRHRIPAFLQPFSRGELFLLYGAICIAPSMDRGVYVLHYLFYPQYYGNEVNLWQEFFQHYPSFYIPQDPRIATGFFEGTRTGLVPWGIWWGPLAWWTTFNMLVMFSVMCLVALFRRQWSESERLTYPLLFLPLEITGGFAGSSMTTGFFRNPLMWLGFSAAAAFNLIRVLHLIWPAVPDIRMWTRIGNSIVDPPWRWLRPLTFYFALDVWGLAYLMSGEVLLSSWGSYFLMKAIKIAGRHAGYRSWRFPFYQEVSSGACIAMAGYMVYVARGHFKRVLRSVIRGPGAYDSNEAMSYRGLFIGLLAGTVAMMWMLKHAGHRTDLLIFYFLTMYMFVLVASRIRAEAGPPVTWTHPYGFDTQVPIHLLGTRYIRGHGSVQPMVLYYSLFYIGRTVFAHSAAQYFTDSLKIVDYGRARRRSVAWLMLLVCLLSMGLALWNHLDIGYRFGQAFFFAREGREHRTWPLNWSRGQYRWLDRALDNPQGPDWQRAWFYAGGFVATLLVTLGRIRIANFPFHPLGIIMGTLYNDWSPYWGPFLIAWIFQRLTLRYGSLPAYRNAVPAFLGLFLGHTLMGGVVWRVLYRLLH
jgi:hypothetical protein